ncbi:DUF5808 domain-containing protein [Chryseobacterium sp. KACC 21268]|nr:DUF5808 domain-containing protein [Chryseobacterium sp. KACC 21268]
MNDFIVHYFFINKVLQMNSSNLNNDGSKLWKYGIFYYNKEDKRLFPPKRNPALGWTINFANAKSIFAFVVMMCFFLFIFFMINNHSQK